jgi:hydrogenase maturation factor
MRVLQLDQKQSLAICSRMDGGATDSEEIAEVAIDLVGPVAVEDLLLVHAGVALANLGDS